MSRKGFAGLVFSYTNDMKEQATMCQNVYATPDGTIHAMPFNVGQGLWFFDGQIFYKLTPNRKEEYER